MMSSFITKSKLQELGSKLINSPYEASKDLRRFQDELKNIPEEKMNELDDSQRFFIYFFDIFIDDLFYNLSGDHPYQKNLEITLRETWRDILKNVGGSILKIADKLDLDDYSSYHKAYASMVSFYLNKINFLDKKLMEN